MHQPEITPIPDAQAWPGAVFRAWLRSTKAGTILVAGHNDADGLAASAIVARGLRRHGREAAVRIVGRGETPWSDVFRDEIEAQDPAGLIVTDLGVRGRKIGEGIPTLVIDHHVPMGTPPGATVVSGHGCDPEPTSSLLALRCVGGLGPAEDLLWLAAIGLIGDMAEAGGFEEMTEARRLHGITRLRKAAS